MYLTMVLAMMQKLARPKRKDGFVGNDRLRGSSGFKPGIDLRRGNLLYAARMTARQREPIFGLARPLPCLTETKN